MKKLLLGGGAVALAWGRHKAQALCRQSGDNTISRPLVGPAGETLRIASGPCSVRVEGGMLLGAGFPSVYERPDHSTINCLRALPLPEGIKADQESYRYAYPVVQDASIVVSNSASFHLAGFGATLLACHQAGGIGAVYRSLYRNLKAQAGTLIAALPCAVRPFLFADSAAWFAQVTAWAPPGTRGEYTVSRRNLQGETLTGYTFIPPVLPEGAEAAFVSPLADGRFVWFERYRSGEELALRLRASVYAAATGTLLWQAILSPPEWEPVRQDLQAPMEPVTHRGLDYLIWRKRIDAFDEAHSQVIGWENRFWLYVFDAQTGSPVTTLADTAIEGFSVDPARRCWVKTESGLSYDPETNHYIDHYGVDRYGLSLVDGQPVFTYRKTIAKGTVEYAGSHPSDVLQQVFRLIDHP